MKEKSPQEQTAAARQVELIVNALKFASDDGLWLNPSGKERPRIYPQNTMLSPFNSLIVGLHSDSGNYSTSLYTTFNEAKKHGDTVLKDERSVPMNWYRWNSYVNRYDAADKISREDYLQLAPDQQKLYKGVRQREIRPLFNLEQTSFPMRNPNEMDKFKENYGSAADRGNIAQEDRNRRGTVAFIREKVNENLIPIRKSTTGIAHYDTAKDAVYMPDQKHYANYPDYVQDMMRQIISATGHRERTAREGMVMRGGVANADSVKYEQLVSELASGVKMMELGLPAKLAPESMQHIDYWAEQLQQNPCMIDAIETDVNNAIQIIHKAEMGERMQLKGDSNRQQTEEFRGKDAPQVSSADALILQDIMAHGGMEINDLNFKSRDEMRAFLDKYNLTGYKYSIQETLEHARAEENPEVANMSYTAAAQSAVHAYNIAAELYPQDAQGSYIIADQLNESPDKRAKMFVVVQDKETGITDVILPGSARSGGDVVMPSGDRRNYWLTPDEVMSADERKEEGAKVVSHNTPGLNKEKINAALTAAGASYVRFYSVDGHLAYRPDDGYFNNKEVYTAKLVGREIQKVSQLDVSDAAKLATEARFERIQMLKDDNGKWAMYLKPENEPSFCVYPDKEDTNRFFSTVRQYDQNAANAVRNELAQKYYALAKANPELQRDLFTGIPEDIDTSMIERVNVFKNKVGKDENAEVKYLCLPKITGVNRLQPREITPLQWQRLWITDDVSKYKTALAANLFADVLLQQKEAEKVEEHNEETAKVDDFPNLKQVDELKAKHPDAVILMRHNDFYESVRGDADTVSKVCGIEKFERVKADKSESVIMTSFPAPALDTYLPKLIRAGHRVAICEQLEAPKQEIGRNEEHRSGMRM